MELLTPAGAFYAWVKFDTDMDSETLCNDLLDKAKIAGVPGIAYGEEQRLCLHPLLFCSIGRCVKNHVRTVKNLSNHSQ